MIPLFVPPLVAGVAWGILGSPKTGLLNTVLKWIGIDFRFDFYSMSGLIVVFGIYYAPYVYMFTVVGAAQHGPEPRGSLRSLRRLAPSRPCSP